MRGGLPWHPSSKGAKESFNMGCPRAAQQVSIVPQKNLCSLELLTTPIVGKPPWPRDPTPLKEGAIRNRKSNLSDRLILALTSDARDLD